MTNMGKTEGIFLNLQCDCHRVASIFINKKDQSTYLFQHLAARFDSAMNKWTLAHLPGAFFFYRTHRPNKINR